MKRSILALAAVALLPCGMGRAKADSIATFDLTWSGAAFGNNATPVRFSTANRAFAARRRAFRSAVGSSPAL
jgi:hypothetical protein